jgi:putative DNA methylase
MQPIKTPKKLIEVALPLDDINEAAAREKSIRHGHPSTLHLWWARRPLAAARAVIFAQMVNDPGYERSLGRGVNKEKAQVERERLFGIIRRLVQWENTNNESVLAEAREEICKSWRETCELNRNHPQAAELFNPDKLPAFHDPFAGGGAIPLEAQRLGLESHASDLNPVAVLINKAMIEIPPRFTNHPPLGPIPQSEKQAKMVQDWSGVRGLAEDVRRYGAWMREEAFKRIGKYYPQADLPIEYGGGKATVIAWIWARTVKSPNPAYSHVDVPLASTFILSSKTGKEAYVEPVIEGDKYRFIIKYGKANEAAKAGTSAGKRSGFLCLFSGSPIDYNYVRNEGREGRIGEKLMAVVVEGKRGRIYLSPTSDVEELVANLEPSWRPELKLDGKCRVNVANYGFDTFGDLFSPRQLLALTTFSDLVQEVQKKAHKDAINAGFCDDGVSLSSGGSGATAYAEAVAVYLAFAVDKGANYWSSACAWSITTEKMISTFGRQALPMIWDYTEANPFSDSSGNWDLGVAQASKLLNSVSPGITGQVKQADAQTQSISLNKVISTDPPYYDNIAYADLSDFFYVWLRRALRSIFPDLFSTMAVPKAEELVATPYRHGSKQAAEKFFLDGMTEAMRRLAHQAHPVFPTTIYYAFKQSDNTDTGTGNTGWETFLEAVIRSGFMITGTWPMRTEYTGNLKKGMNALASSIVLVCSRREDQALSISRRDFLRELKEQLSEAVDVMIGGSEGISPVAPVDLAQAVIGPGMAIFSKYSSVLEADGSPMTVHTALTLINRMLIDDPEGFDGDTQFCLGWFDEHGWATGEFGKADVLARAKGTSVDGVRDAGVVEAGSGKVRLLKPAEYEADWNPEEDNRTPVWEALHQMIRMLQTQGESAAGSLLAQMPERAEPIRSLAYRLYTLCERKGWAEEARGYNELITSWLGIEAASHEAGHLGSQAKLDI